MIWRSNLDGSRRAAFSECGSYRYILLIVWDSGLPRMASVGLNPSIASEAIQDPTLSRECERAARMGFGSLLKLNLFAIISTDPKGMLQAEDPYGEWDSVCDLIRAIREHEAEAMVCATWGNHGHHRGRATEFREGTIRMGLKLWAYEVNMSGEPKHPLYLPYSVKPQPYIWEDSACQR
jgi:hypothetical protein